MTSSLPADLSAFVVSDNEALTLMAEGAILRSVDLGSGQVSVIAKDGVEFLVFQTATDKAFVLPAEVICQSV